MTGAIEKNIVDPLAKWILEEAAAGNNTVRGGLIKISMKDGRVAFTAEKKPEKTIARVSVQDAAADDGGRGVQPDRAAGGRRAERGAVRGLFDQLLRAARPAGQAAAKTDAAPAAARVLRSGRGPGSAGGRGVAAALTDKAADGGAASQGRGRVRDHAAGWPEAVIAALPDAGRRDRRGLAQADRRPSPRSAPRRRA